MVDFDWTINGRKPRWIIDIDETTFPKITLHCASYLDETYEPIDEIELFKAMACLKITNEVTNSGGTDLQASIDGSLIPISNGVDNWLGALYYPQYNPNDTTDNLIKFDLIFELGLVNKEIIPDPETGEDTTRPYNLITNGYSYQVQGQGDATQYLGTFSFNWDGTGHVYICSDWLADPETDIILIDDAIVVTNIENDETLDVVYGMGVYTTGGNRFGEYNPSGVVGPALEITSLLVEGSNDLTIGIRDVYGTYLTCGPLFMVQV
jgi:hypothetical protein